jgi:hypothetical protein
MLNKEGDENINSLCLACDSENEYFKLNPPQQNFTQKYTDCDKYAKLFITLKEREDQCYQFKKQINYSCHHQLHQKFNQIKSFETQLKTGITESLCKPLMKIVHKLLISDKFKFEHLTPTEQTLWTFFETEDIYRFLMGEPTRYQNYSTTGLQFQGFSHWDQCSVLLLLLQLRQPHQHIHHNLQHHSLLQTKIRVTLLHQVLCTHRRLLQPPVPDQRLLNQLKLRNLNQIHQAPLLQVPHLNRTPHLKEI